MFSGKPAPRKRNHSAQSAHMDGDHPTNGGTATEETSPHHYIIPCPHSDRTYRESQLQATAFEDYGSVQWWGQLWLMHCPRRTICYPECQGMHTCHSSSQWRRAHSLTASEMWPQMHGHSSPICTPVCLPHPLVPAFFGTSPSCLGASPVVHSLCHTWH